MSVTREQIEAGEREFHENHDPEARRVVRWRANGKLKTWVTRPREWVLPIKYGLRGYSYMTETNAGQFHTEAECPSRKFPEIIPFEISQAEIDLGDPCESMNCPAVLGILVTLGDMGYGEDVVVQVGRQEVSIWRGERDDVIVPGTMTVYDVPTEMRDWTRRLDRAGKDAVWPVSFEIRRRDN